MKAQIDKLYKLSLAKSRRIVGLMSGTSMDGLDIVLCRIEGSGPSSKVQVENFTTVPYSDLFKSKLKPVFANPNAPLMEVTLLHAWVAREHADLILSALKHWGVQPEDIDILASHGQTIFHAPAKQHGIAGYPDATMQIVDGDHLAVLTQIITVSDFRQKHVAAGEEGAPLAVYGDYFLFSKLGENRIMLNIGGISNLTFLPGSLDASKVFSTDIGPGNTLMDQYVFKYFGGLAYDKDSEIAKRGELSEALLNALLNNDFFERDFPKTTGPEVFNLEYLTGAQEISGTIDLKHEDVLCTLCHFTAQAIVRAISGIYKKNGIEVLENLSVYASGGGIHNVLLMELIKTHLPEVNFQDFNALGIPPDAKEAVLFAVLANETIAGETVSFGKNTGVPAISMGKISLPK